MQHVITQNEARKITGGRKPLVPVEYEQAVTSLESCLSIDDAKVWADKADALAAWAKIYHSDKASLQARRLKLHAFRRMGLLAAELRPLRGGLNKGEKISEKRGGTFPGPRSLLMESGLKGHEAGSAAALARLPKPEFTALLNLPRPPSPNSFFGQKPSRSGSEAWNSLIGAGVGPGTNSAGCLSSFITWLRNRDPATLARSLKSDEAIKARSMAIEASEWLDQFEQNLAKSVST